MSEVIKRLQAPFPEEDVEWRVQSSGGGEKGKPWVRIIPYITNVGVQRRLDEVCGPEGWQNRYEEFTGGVICGISIRLATHSGFEWVTKWDGAASTDIEAFKGALSGAMKRAAVQWGIGRYLHDIGEQFAILGDANDRNANYLKPNPQKHGAALTWKPPRLPAKFLPVPVKPEPPTQRGAAPTPMAATVAKLVEVPASGAVKLPGSKGSLMGYGGAEIATVPREHLPEIRAKLNEIDAVRYAGIIAAIENYLEETREG